MSQRMAEFSLEDAKRIAKAVKAVETDAYRSIPPRSSENAVKTGRSTAVQITGPFDKLLGMYPCIIVGYDDFTDDFVDVGLNYSTLAWLLLDPDDSPDDVGNVLNGMLVGILPSDERPIILRSYKAPIPVTSTTAVPCTGSCLYTYTYSTMVWSKTSGSCGTGCVCVPPTFCPPAPTGTECNATITYSSYCTRSQSETVVYPNCTATTTTTTTSTTPPVCGTQCKWEWDSLDMVYLRVDEDVYYCQGTCDCVEPIGIPAPIHAYDNFYTPCYVLSKECGGQCHWTKLPSGWNKDSTTCNGVCTCDYPPVVGTNGDSYITYCLDPNGGTPSYTTQPPTPYDCSGGSCKFTYSAADSVWKLLSSTCPYCACVVPSSPGVDCEIRITGCKRATTTTTTPGITTSTTPEPCPSNRHCTWNLYITKCVPLEYYVALTESNCVVTNSRCNPNNPPEVDISYIQGLIATTPCDQLTGKPIGPAVTYCCDGTTTTTSTTCCIPCPPTTSSTTTTSTTPAVTTSTTPAVTTTSTTTFAACGQCNWIGDGSGGWVKTFDACTGGCTCKFPTFASLDNVTNTITNCTGGSSTTSTLSTTKPLSSTTTPV